MKGLLNALGTFSRVERLAFGVLATLLMVLTLIFATLRLWVHPRTYDAGQQTRLATAYNTWLARERGFSGIATGTNSAGTSPAGAPFVFDPNLIDSAGLIRLGMPVRAVKGLLGWRRKGKHFYKPEDLKPLYNLPEEVYTRLEPYMTITGQDDRAGNSPYNSFPPIPSIIDLNSVDSAILDRGVPGIGATLAHKIIQRRSALGGFIKHEQLLEVYKFPDTTFQKMKQKLHIDPSMVKRIHLNSATLAQLSVHPYVGEVIAKNIILYREGIRHYDNVSQLRQVPLMNEEIYRKIAPYFVVD